jgi:putative membrane protein
MEQDSRTLRDYLLLIFRGMAMGAADVVPGVSGGTIAFISGIYEELIDSLRRIDHKAVACLFQQGIVAAWRYINGNFLLAVFGGVLFSVFSLAKLITYCLDAFPILVWAFFFGLILASGVYISRSISLRTWPTLLAFGLGIALALAVSVMRPASLPGDWWIVMLSGSLAICAMILPGVSGSFILLMIGIYGVILEAVSSFNLVLLASFGIGCVAGLLLFSHVLSWMLRRFHDVTLALLTGFLLGSLNVIWPWKQTLTTMVNRHGETVPLVQENILPWTYQSLTGNESQLIAALATALLGFGLVLLLEYGLKSSTKLVD